MLADVSEVSSDGSEVSLNRPATCAQLATGWADAIQRAEPWQPADRPVLVVVPHPDDESLMFGGLLARLARHGTPVHVVAVTDGGAAYPDAVDPPSLARLRRAEQDDALTELGLAGATVARLGIPDGSVANHEDELVDAIATVVDDEAIGSVLTPWDHDHHADHETCGRAVRRARRHSASSYTIVSGLFWSMLREPAPPELALAALVLTSDEMMRKSAAIRRHRSQIGTLVCDEPVLGDHELALTRWRREHLIVDPAT